MTTLATSNEWPCAHLTTCLLGTATASINNDFEQRVVQFPSLTQWRRTLLGEARIRVLELFAGTNPRLSALIELPATSPSLTLPANALEVLLLQGQINSDGEDYQAGFYLRNPWQSAQEGHSMSLGYNENSKHSAAHPEQDSTATGSLKADPNETKSDALDSRSTSSHITDSNVDASIKSVTEGCLLYVSAGQLVNSDKEKRRIDTSDQSRWLPGPVDGTEVMPLHMHKGSNAMLIRWLEDASFKPRLDPLGEEVLVLEGELYDTDGRYEQHSWIRNPVSHWQNWHGKQGTLVYYKNGHFAQA